MTRLSTSGGVTDGAAQKGRGGAVPGQRMRQRLRQRMSGARKINPETMHELTSDLRASTQTTFYVPKNALLYTPY